MKRIVSLLLFAVLLLGLLSACQEEVRPMTVKALPVGSLTSAALDHSGLEDQNGLEEISAKLDREWMEAYIENVYGLEDPWEDAAVIRATGASAFEIAVLRMAGADSAVRAATALMSYIYTRQGDFAGYAPDEANMVAAGSILQDGCYAGLFICPDPDGAREAVEAVLSGENLSAEESAHSGTPVSDVKKLRDILVENHGVSEMDLVELDDRDSEALTTDVQETYGIDASQWEECAIARDIKGSAFEVAVFRMGAAVGDAEQKLNTYLNTREAQFDSSSEAAKLLHQAITIVAENYVVLLACPDAEDAAQTFSNASGSIGFGWAARYQYTNADPNYPDRCAFNAPNIDDMSLYDTSAILAAWEKGDPSGLAKEDWKIYDAAQKVLKKVLADGMNDYEKEVAVYSWVVQNVDYDWTHQDHMKATPRESFTPYGGLVNHKAVCLGYATTFQLLMDMAGVECITVPGAAFSSTEDHGWNMVRLNGEWYCVDVTWDANMREQIGLGGQENWDFFNITSDDMAASNHQWDYANTPEATAVNQGRD